MLQVITSYLIQNEECTLPNIGSFSTAYKTAESDIVNRQLLPPAEEIVFFENTFYSIAGLVKYIAHTKNIPESVAEKELYDFTTTWKEKINAGEKLCFDTVGYLQKNDSGKIVFINEDILSGYQPVEATRIIHEHAQHNVLVGDTQTNSSVMNKYYSEEKTVEKDRWHIWAFILINIAIILLVYSFYNHKFSPTGVGNRSSLIIKEAGETYRKVSK